MNEYMVYKHTSPLGKVYIGITSRNNPKKRWQNGKGYQGKHFYNAIKKYAWENIKHEILFTGLSQEEAKQKEIEFIKKYNSANPQYGYNVSLGGDVVADSTKKKLGGITKERWKDPEYRKTITEKMREFTSSDEFKKAMGRNSKERWKDPEYHRKTVAKMQGRLRTDEQKEHYRIASTGRKLSEETKKKVGEASASRVGEKATHRRSVLKVEIGTYNVLEEYLTARQAALALNMSINRIASACRSKSGFCNGFLWCYKDEFSEAKISYWKNLPLTEKGIDKSGENNASYGIHLTEDQRRKISEAHSTKIINLDTGKIYPSVKAAEIEIAGRKTGSISKCLRGIVNTSLGYRWAYYEKE